MIHQVVEDVVQRRLDLIGRRSLSQSLIQGFLTLAIVGFVVAYLATIAGAFAAKMPADWLGRFDCWWRMIAALLIMGLPALLIGGAFLRLIGAISDGWRRLTWDGRTGELVAVQRGGWLGLREQTTIPLAEIRRIDLHAAPGNRDLKLQFTIRSAKQLEREPLAATLIVRGIDRREEAMDLLFRIGRLCGLAHYAVEQSDLRNLKLRLVRETKGNERFQPVPAGTSAGEYQDDSLLLAVAAPEIRVGPFRPETFGESVAGTRLVEWRPGERIHFHSPPADWLAFAAAAFPGAVVAGLIAWEAAPLAAAWLPGWGVMAIAIVGGALVGCAAVYCWFLEREVIFDWQMGQISWRVGRWRRSAPLTAMEGLLLRGLRHTVKRKNSASRTYYSCRLEMMLAGKRVLLAESIRFHEGPDLPPQRLGPLAAALAQSLGVPWKWQDYNH